LKEKNLALKEKIEFAKARIYAARGVLARYPHDKADLTRKLAELESDAAAAPAIIERAEADLAQIKQSDRDQQLLRELRIASTLNHKMERLTAMKRRIAELEAQIARAS